MKWNLIIPYLWSHCQKTSCEFFEFLTRMLRLQMIENSPEPRRIRKAKKATRTYSSESNSDISPMLFLHNSLRNWDVASWHLMFQVDSLLHLKKLILSVEKLKCCWLTPDVSVRIQSRSLCNVLKDDALTIRV